MHEVFKLGLSGSSRRSDNTVIEQLISLDETEITTLPDNASDQRERVERVLSDHGLVEILGDDTVSGSRSPAESLGWLYASLATGLQHFAGHRVNHVQLEPRKDTREFHAIFEYEYWDLGWNASRLAMAIVCEAFPELKWPIEMQPPFEDFEAEWMAFQTLADNTLLPVDTEAMIMAARQLGIPCIKLEREPYQALEGDFRIRRNSMLKLGHCAHQLVLDGMLCIDRSQSLIDAYHDRMSLLKLSETYRFIIPYNQNKYRNNNSHDEMKKTAELLQYPLVIKPRRRSHGEGVSLAIESDGQLQVAIGKALTTGAPALLERHVAGNTYRALLVGHTPIAVIASNGQDVINLTDQSIVATAIAIARGTGVGMLEMTIVTADISQPLSAASGAVVDVDFSPRLDRFLEPGSELMQRAVIQFLHWLYPAGTLSRIPMVIITGTNGKTTTSRMTSSILTKSGLTTAMCCTDGIYRDGELISRTRDVQGDPHWQQLDDPEVQAVVLETHFGRIARVGFPWQECDVGICTNVTQDHIGRLGTETLEEMAILKRSVPERARHAVLNADDPHCMAMFADFTGKRVTLTTLHPVDSLEIPAHTGELNICSIENVDGRDWIILTEKGERKAVMAVSDIPATFNGSARHNTSNAQQAIAASRATGASIEVISGAMASFKMNIRDTPGRLNIHDNGHFKVILDFAHNPDGIKLLAHYTDDLKITGQRIIVYSVSMLASDDLIMATAAAAAGHFDIYICRDVNNMTDRPSWEVPRIMRRGLEEQGVAAEAIIEISDEDEAIDHALALCAEGDLLFVQSELGKHDAMWSTILEAGR